MLPRVKIKAKTIRSKYNNRLNIEDKESLENLNINRLTKANISDKVLEDDIYLSRAPKTDMKILTPLEKGIILESSTSSKQTSIFKDYGSKDNNLVEELKPEHKFKVKPSELDNEAVNNIIEVPKSKVRYYYEKTDNNNKILDTLQQKGGIFKLSQEDEIIEFIDISCKLEKAIENNFDKNWFLHKISDKSQLYGKADLLLSNSETGESISLQLKLKESTINNIDLLKLDQLYKDTDIIKKERSLINSEIRLTVSQNDIRPNIVEPTVIKKEYICREYSIKDYQDNFKSKFNDAINGNDIIVNRDDKFNQD